MVALETVAVTLESLPEIVRPRDLFGSEEPFELEIGCGKAGFLLDQAKAHPERNYLGIEWANEFYKFASDRMARWGVTNVRILRTDARQFMISRLAPASLSALHVYHPDPWPKKRHHKRRLFTPEFVAAAVRAMVPSGRWAIQTDHAEYFEVIREVTAARAELGAIPFEVAKEGDGAESVATNFEIKYRREGREIYRLAYRKNGE